MPNKAKLVLRETTTSTVTEDELKSSPLTFQQIDSNFLNLRDQTIGIAGDDSTTINLSAGNTLKIAGAGTVTTAVSGDTLTITGTGGSGSAQGITVVGDDSTGTLIADGETVKIAGAQNITTAVSGDTLTITGPNLSSYATQSYVTSQGYITNSPLTIVGDDSTGTILNTGETIKIAGASNITTAVSGDTLTITGPNLSSYATTTYVDNKVSANNTLTIADDTSTTGSIDLDNTLQVLGGNNITTSISGGTLTISGDKSIDVNEINSGDSSAIQINDALNVSGTLNAKTIVTNDLISEDSTAIQVLDDLGVSGNLSVTGDITTADSLQFDTAAAEAVATGKLYYSSAYGTLAHGLSDGSEIIDGVDLVAYVTNAEATTLTKGTVVYIFGASGDRPSVKRADNSGDPTSSKTLGIVKNDITAGNAGYVVTQGIITGLNLGTYTAGDVLWLGTSGAFTATKPTYPAHLVFIGVVLRANAGNGLVYVKPQNGYELGELHDVDVSTAVANDILKYDGSAWVNHPGNIKLVGDDSTGTTIDIGETVKIAGTQNITTAVSGDTITITGPNLSSYITNSPITIVGDDSTGTTLNTGETLKIAGTSNITTAVSGDTLTITGPNLSSYATQSYVDSKVSANNTLTIADDTSTTSAIDLDNTLQVIGGNNITTSISGSTLTITGDKSIDVNEINSGDSSAIQINDAVNISGTLNAKTIVTNDLISENSTAIQVIDGLNVSGTLTADTFSTTNISSTSPNGAITITPNGTGDVYLTADTVRVGDSNANATITTNGTGDLILNTNSGTNSGSITIADAANGDITIKVDGTGKVILGDDFTAANLDNYTNVSNSFPGFSDSATIKGNLMFTSNLSVPNITQFSERHFNNTIYSYGKADSSATTYNDNDFRWGNNALALFDMNGATANSTVTGSRAAAIRGIAISTAFKNSGGGTKTTPNQTGLSTFNEIQEGHGGDLTVVNQMGARMANSVRANTGEFSRITNSIGFLSETMSVGGTGANGTNRFVTNEYAFYDAPTTSSSLVTNHYGYYVHTGSAATNKYAFYSADDTYLSRLGTIERYLEKQNALTSSSTITVDANLAPVHTVTLGINTQFGIANLSTGQTVTLIIRQDGTGNKTATFTSDTSTAVKFAGGVSTLSTAANAIDVVKIYNDGTNLLGKIEKAYA